jgi:hypothetical protein
VDDMKFKVTVEHVVRTEHEMTLEDETITGALDQALKMVATRNKTNKVGQFFVAKIETKEK